MEELKEQNMEKRIEEMMKRIEKMEKQNNEVAKQNEGAVLVDENGNVRWESQSERNERIIRENERKLDGEAREGETRFSPGIAYAVFGALALMASIIGLGIGAAGIIGVVKLIGWLLSL